MLAESNTRPLINVTRVGDQRTGTANRTRLEDMARLIKEAHADPKNMQPDEHGNVKAQTFMGGEVYQVFGPNITYDQVSGLYWVLLGGEGNEICELVHEHPGETGWRELEFNTDDRACVLMIFKNRPVFVGADLKVIDSEDPQLETLYNVIVPPNSFVHLRMCPGELHAFRQVGLGKSAFASRHYVDISKTQSANMAKQTIERERICETPKDVLVEIHRMFPSIDEPENILRTSVQDWAERSLTPANISAAEKFASRTYIAASFAAILSMPFLGMRHEAAKNRQIQNLVESAPNSSYVTVRHSSGATYNMPLGIQKLLEAGITDISAETAAWVVNQTKLSTLTTQDANGKEIISINPNQIIFSYSREGINQLNPRSHGNHTGVDADGLGMASNSPREFISVTPKNLSTALNDISDFLKHGGMQIQPIQRANKVATR